MTKIAAIPFIVSAIMFIIWAITVPPIRKTSFFLGFVFSALAFLLIALSPPAQARAGGGFSVGRSSTSIIRSYSAPAVVSPRSTTILNNHGGGAAFMAVQDAVGKKNLGVLQGLCTPSMYSALLTTNMEPSVISNLSYMNVEEDVYIFTFLADGEKHKETWCFDDEDRLDGIQVHF